MTTDTKAVTRWDVEAKGEGLDSLYVKEFETSCGPYVLFTDHERVVGELKEERMRWFLRAGEYLKRAQAAEAALAASRAEVEGLRAACSGSAYTLFLDAYYKACETSKPSDWHDAAMLAKQWEQQIDAELEKKNV